MHIELAPPAARPAAYHLYLISRYMQPDKAMIAAPPKAVSPFSSAFFPKKHPGRPARCLYVCDLVFLSRYIRPEGPWQRLRRCLKQRRWLFLYTLFPCARTGLTGHSGPPTPPTVKKDKGKKKSPARIRQKEKTKEKYILGRARTLILSAPPPPVLWGHSPDTSAPHSRGT